MRRRAEQVNEVGVAGRLSVAEAGLKEHHRQLDDFTVTSGLFVSP